MPFVLLAAVAAMLGAGAPALAQPARVTALVTRPGDGRDIATTNDAVRESAEGLLARCEPAGRAARPLHQQYFTLSVDTAGRVIEVTPPPVPTEALDLTQVPAGMRPVTGAERARVARYISCIARALRRLRFPAAPPRRSRWSSSGRSPAPPPASSASSAPRSWC
jgi:hypothetical protein